METFIGFVVFDLLFVFLDGRVSLYLLTTEEVKQRKLREIQTIFYDHLCNILREENANISSLP